MLWLAIKAEKIYNINTLIRYYEGKGVYMNPYDQFSPQYQEESDFKRFMISRKQVPVNTFLIFLNLLVFAAVELTGSALDTMHMYRWGAGYAPAIIVGKEYYRLVTAMFLHFGIQHLGNNMLVLLFLGDCLERNIGKFKYLLIYFVGGVGANILSTCYEVIKKDGAVSAGASGAVFAVIGAMIYILLINKGHIESFTAKRLIFMAALSLYLGITSAGIDNMAHFGGLIFGFLLGILLYRRPKRKRT